MLCGIVDAVWTDGQEGCLMEAVLAVGGMTPSGQIRSIVWFVD